MRTHRARTAAVTEDELWRAASELRLADTRRVGRLVRWRIPGTPREITYFELLERYPFVSLERGRNLSLSGLCGKIWTLRRDYPRLEGVEDFCDWGEPGTVRVLFAHWTESADSGRSRLVSEARVEPVDRHARRRLRALWAMVGRFEPLIGAEPLTLAAKRAEHSAG